MSKLTYLCLKPVTKNSKDHLFLSDSLVLSQLPELPHSGGAKAFPAPPLTTTLIGEFLKQMALAKIQDLNKKVARLGFVTQVTMLRSFAIVYTFNSTRM